MGRKHIINPYKMFDQADLSGNITQDPKTDVQQLDKASIKISWSGTAPVGTLEVQGRNGDQDSWTALDFGTSISISGNTGNHTILFNELPFKEIRLVYTATSGTGTIDAILHAKTVGA